MKQTEKESEARRGGVYVFIQLFRALKKDIFSVFDRDLRTVQRTLLHISICDEDLLTREHATTALAELALIAEELVAPPSSQNPYEFLRVI